MRDKIPLHRPYFDENELHMLHKTLNSGWVAKGNNVKRFEEKFTQYFSCPHACAVSSCTAALHIAMMALDIKNGDEVLVSDYTFPATGHAVMYTRAKPVFVDVDQNTFNIDINLIEDKITDNTKAIIPVHAFGRACDIISIKKIAKKYGLFVIEDAACAIGSWVNSDIEVGQLGDFNCFSFHGRKTITTGEGGMITTNDYELIKKAQSLSTFGIEDIYKSGIQFTQLGYNYKMSDIAAALGLSQLNKLHWIINRKRELAYHYYENFREMNLTEHIISELPNDIHTYFTVRPNHNYQSFVILLDNHINRDQVVMNLRKKNIEANIGTYASHLQPVYQSKDICPTSAFLYKQALSLPLYYDLKKEQIDYICNCLQEIL